MSDDKYRNIFSQRFKYYMDLKGVRQQDLIKDLGLSSGTVSMWVNGQRLPRMGKIQMLADYFGISTTDLLSEEQSFTTDPADLIRDKFNNLTPDNRHAVTLMIDSLLATQEEIKKETTSTA